MSIEKQLEDLRAVAASAASLLHELERRTSSLYPPITGIAQTVKAIEEQLAIPMPQAGRPIDANAGQGALRFFHVQLGYSGAEGRSFVIGQWSGLAVDTKQARDLCMAQHWDSRLDASGASPVFEVNNPPRYIVCEDWDHIFVGNKVSCTRWVLDRATDSLVVAQIAGSGKWTDLTQSAADHLHESLNQNSVWGEAVTDWGAREVDEVPAWDLPAPGATQPPDEDTVPPVVEIIYTEAQVSALSKMFLYDLLAQIGLEQMREVAAANLAEPDPAICHSHDVCDANVVMAQAFESLMRVQVDIRSASQAQLWNAAWSQARLAMPGFVERAAGEQIRTERERSQG